MSEAEPALPTIAPGGRIWLQHVVSLHAVQMIVGGDNPD